MLEKEVPDVTGKRRSDDFEKNEIIIEGMKLVNVLPPNRNVVMLTKFASMATPEVIIFIPVMQPVT